MKELRRIGAIGDVHCEDVVLARAIETLRDAGSERIVCVGDIVDGLGDANRTCELLREHQIQCVAGNHERWFLTDKNRSITGVTPKDALAQEHQRWLATLPQTARLATPLGNLLVCHGVGEDDMAFLQPETRGYALQAIDVLRELMLDPEVDFMLGGHTHQRMVRRFQGITVVNAGTIHRNFEVGVILLDFEEERVRCFDWHDDRFQEGESISLPRPAPLS